MLTSNQSGNRYSYTLQCDQPELASSGDFVSGATRYQGRMHTAINDPAMGKMQIAQQFSARRVGDCR
jgi:hypothetical protein